ncbi:unnamed protein product [Pipistrellus nathusii]|uniref:Uncharacterized protein n=1 Tax=Pipistrellus nathusii TaxID=59473 RepID=A0ABP0A8R1_PIPNA
MNEPPAGMGAPRLRGAAPPARAPLGLGRAELFMREAGRGPPRAAGTPSPPAAAAAGGAPEARGAGEDLDSESRVREKVLFLLHPERGQRARGDPAREEGADREAQGCPPAHLPRETRAPRAARPPSVLVRVEDYRATEEVQLTEWARGCLATRTAERAVTVLTFRTGGDAGSGARGPPGCGETDFPGPRGPRR